MPLTGSLTPAPVDPAEEDEVRAGRALERDDNQQLLDGMTGEIIAAWKEVPGGMTSLETLRTKAGFKAAPKRSVTVDAKDKSVVKAMIRRTCTLHKVTPVYANDKTNDDGTIRVKWTVGPYVARTRNKATETTPEASDPETPTSAEDVAQDTEPQPASDANPDDAATASGRRGARWGNR